MAYIIKESAHGYDRVSPDDVLLTNRKIFLTDEINSSTADELLKSLMALNAESDEAIELYINSPGGECFSGLAIIDYIKIMKAPLTTICTGIAASMAGLLFLSGDRREMFKSTRLMLHDPSWSNGKNIGGMKPHQLQQEVDKLMEVRSELAAIIASVSGKTMEEVYEVTKDDSFFTATQALEWNLATNIIGQNTQKGNSNEKNIKRKNSRGEH